VSAFRNSNCEQFVVLSVVRAHRQLRNSLSLQIFYRKTAAKRSVYIKLRCTGKLHEAFPRKHNYQFLHCKQAASLLENRQMQNIHWKNTPRIDDWPTYKIANNKQTKMRQPHAPSIMYISKQHSIVYTRSSFWARCRLFEEAVIYRIIYLWMLLVHTHVKPNNINMA